MILPIWRPGLDVNPMTPFKHFDYGMLVVNLLLIDTVLDIYDVPWREVFRARFASRDIN